MNNNRQTNNRRRGRGNSNNNRPSGNNRNGFDNQNRIDNRARGNASQMLEKYKKLASDAQHNDDRVNAEYYLQFADHYFRVLADSKARQDERQDGQQNRRPQYRDEGRDEGRDDAQIGDASDFDGFDARDDNGEASADGHDDRAMAAETAAPEKSADNPQRRPRSRGTGRNGRDGRDPMIRDHEQSGLDLSILPPSISISDNSAADSAGDAENSKPARKPRARKPKASGAGAVVAAE